MAALVFAFSAQAAKPAPAEPAAPAGEITVEGTISCAKCALKEADACADVVKAGDAVYYLEEGGKVKTSVHQCKGEAAVKVTGTVEERDGKKYLIVSAIEKK